MKAPAFQFYPSDWLSSSQIMLMSPAEEGAYIRLLAIAWGNDDCGLPDDDETLAVLSRLNEGWFNGGSTKIRKCFKAKKGRLYNERLLLERKKQEEWKEKSRKGGIKSGMIRNNNNLTSEGWLKGGSTVVEPNGNISSSSSSSSSNINKPPIPPFKFPEWISEPIFLEYQQSRHKKLKPASFEKFFKKLKRLAEDSNVTAEDILNQSIENGWDGIFAIKEITHNGNKGHGRRTGAGKPYEKTGRVRNSEESIYYDVVGEG